MVKGRTTGGSRLGARVKALRRKEGLSQAQLAQRLGVSASYLNLIENDRRPLTAELLLKLTDILPDVDVRAFAAREDASLITELQEALDHPMFESAGLTNADVKELVAGSPATARAMLTLWRAYERSQHEVDTLAERLGDGDEGLPVERHRYPSEEVSDLIQSHMNHFPALEEGAERLWRDAGLEHDDLYRGLVRYLERVHRVRVRVARWGERSGVLRRFDKERGELVLSELLPTRSRSFQLAHQLALLTERGTLERLAADPRLTTEEARTLMRVALANYFASAVLMPYEPFLEACTAERYDLDVVGRRFRVGFEQVCHRVTTLRRPGAEGVPFHMIRIDVAGNISKRFSASGIRFARFSGACPRWNVFAAFLTPGLIRIQLSKMPDGSSFFCLARTIHKDSGGYHSQQPVMAIGLGCRVEFAQQLVYADGLDLNAERAFVPVGVTCRVCERTDCEQRAVPSLRQPLHIDENQRGVSLYAQVEAPKDAGARRS